MKLINIGFGNLVSAASVFVMDSDHVVLSAIAAEKLAQRLGLEILGGLEENE